MLRIGLTLIGLLATVGAHRVDACPSVLAGAATSPASVTPTLLDALHAEQAIWKQVYSHAPLQKGTWNAFWYPPFPQNPHWNMVFPTQMGQLPTENELAAFATFYEGQKTRGHFLDTEGKYETLAISTDEYFYLPGGSHGQTNTLPPQIQMQETQDLELFSRLVQQGFDFPDSILKEFHSQMVTLQQQIPCRFWIAVCDGTPCGSVSAFETPDGAQFLMNGAVLKTFRGRGAARALIRHAAFASASPVYTHSNDEFIRKHLLPKLGFHSLGKGWLVPVREARGNIGSNP